MQRNNAKDDAVWGGEDVTPGRRSFTLASAYTGATKGAWEIGEAGEINGDNVPNTRTGETSSHEFALIPATGGATYGDLVEALTGKGFESADATLKLILHGGVAGSADQVFEHAVDMQLGA